MRVEIEEGDRIRGNLLHGQNLSYTVKGGVLGRGLSPQSPQVQAVGSATGGPGRAYRLEGRNL